MEQPTYTLTYTGRTLSDFERSRVTHVRIGDNVTEIDREVFADCDCLMYVQGAVQSIHWGAFRNCRSLKRVDISGIVDIASYAFSFCVQLIDGDFLKTVQSIGPYAFLRCESLRSAKLPSATYIGCRAFFHCEGLIEVQFSKELNMVKLAAFGDCTSLREVTLPATWRAQLAGYHLGGPDCFENCRNLTRATVIDQIANAVPTFWKPKWMMNVQREIDRINLEPPITGKKLGPWMKKVEIYFVKYRREHEKSVNLALKELKKWSVITEVIDESTGVEAGHVTKKEKKEEKKIEQIILSIVDVHIRSYLELNV